MNNSPLSHAPTSNQSSPCIGGELISHAVNEAVSQYMDQLDGHPSYGIYDMVIQAVEKSLFDVVLRHTNGNQSQAAILLGISRGTLRKRLLQAGTQT